MERERKMVEREHVTDEKKQTAFRNQLSQHTNRNK